MEYKFRRWCIENNLFYSDLINEAVIVAVNNATLNKKLLNTTKKPKELPVRISSITGRVLGITKRVELDPIIEQAQKQLVPA